MSAIPPPVPPDDPLARAEDALRRAPVPEGPPDETVARTLAALRAAADGPGKAPFPWRRTMGLILKMAAAALVAAGGLFYLGGPGPAGASMVFAEVAGRLRDAQTLSYRMTVEYPGQKDAVSARYLIKGPGLMRGESANLTMIIDVNQGKTLAIDSATKSATLMEGKLVGDRRQDATDVAAQVVDGLKRLAAKRGEPLGKKRIGDVEAVGFRVEEDGRGFDVWADPATKQPVRVEMTIRFQGQVIRGTLSDFALDPKLDDALFRLEPPEGFTLRTVKAEESSPEAAVARLLGIYAEMSGGTFPPRLDDWVAYDQQIRRKKKFSGPTDPEMIRIGRTVVQIQIFLLDSKKEGRGYGYTSDGVKLGDADKVVFWYRPQGAEKYRAVFGDLHIADVTADQLPEKPKP
jgi:outer membrane lipoprotein-sorting protein